MEKVDDDKPYSLELENRGEYLYAIVGGLKVTPEIALGYWHEIIDECDKLGLTKILLEHNFAEMISMHEMLQIIGPVADMLKGRMFAFVERYGHYEIPEAGKTILRGLNIKMQLFTDVEEAEKWLLAN
jgi:hypothetical protein